MEVGDELTDMPKKICEMYLKIDHAPVYTDFKNANAVGVVGAKKALYAMFKNIVIDVSVRHYYGDVRLFLLVDDENNMNGSACCHILETIREHVILFVIMRAKIIFLKTYFVN